MIELTEPSPGTGRMQRAGRAAEGPTDAHNILQLHVHATPTVSAFAFH